jgi:DEAD/DEAH box helicase domain-containing protein
MLHLILGWHHQWGRFYRNLKYVVIDEAHHYRGVFGSNVAFLIRRLRRICNHYGSYPQFILSSATLANPKEFSRNLVGKTFQEVNHDTSPSGKKHFILYNPFAKWGDLSTHQETKNLFQLMVLNDLQTLCFTVSRKMAEIIAMWTKRELNETSQTWLTA